MTAMTDLISQKLDRIDQDLQERINTVKPVLRINNIVPVRQEDACGVNTCMNEGVCVVQSTGDFECKCPWGWTGKRCEICLTECASNPCPSNKKCKAKYLGGYECVCPADKVGLDCEIQNDLCASEPCLNGGVCKPVEGGTFTCVCDKPWSGDNCERSILVLVIYVSTIKSFQCIDISHLRIRLSND